jgi:hypothetical protein
LRNVSARRPVLQKVLEGITQLISNPVLLLGGMALLVAIKVLVNPDREE